MHQHLHTRRSLHSSATGAAKHTSIWHSTKGIRAIKLVISIQQACRRLAYQEVTGTTNCTGVPMCAWHPVATVVTNNRNAATPLHLGCCCTTAAAR